jgi:hypothetical protein
MRQVCEAEALEGLGRCAADFRVVYETFKLERLCWHVRQAIGALQPLRGSNLNSEGGTFRQTAPPAAPLPTIRFFVRHRRVN